MTTAPSITRTRIAKALEVFCKAHNIALEGKLRVKHVEHVATAVTESDYVEIQTGLHTVRDMTGPFLIFTPGFDEHA